MRVLNQKVIRTFCNVGLHFFDIGVQLQFTQHVFRAQFVQAHHSQTLHEIGDEFIHLLGMLPEYVMLGLVKGVKFRSVHYLTNYLKQVDAELHRRGLIVGTPNDQRRRFQTPLFDKL